MMEIEKVSIFIIVVFGGVGSFAFDTKKSRVGLLLCSGKPVLGAAMFPGPTPEHFGQRTCAGPSNLV